MKSRLNLIFSRGKKKLTTTDDDAGLDIKSNELGIQVEQRTL